MFLIMFANVSEQITLTGQQLVSILCSNKGTKWSKTSFKLKFSKLSEKFFNKTKRVLQSIGWVSNFIYFISSWELSISPLQSLSFLKMTIRVSLSSISFKATFFSILQCLFNLSTSWNPDANTTLTLTSESFERVTAMSLSSLHRLSSFTIPG